MNKKKEFFPASMILDIFHVNNNNLEIENLTIKSKNDGQQNCHGDCTCAVSIYCVPQR